MVSGPLGALLGAPGGALGGPWSPLGRLGWPVGSPGPSRAGLGVGWTVLVAPKVAFGPAGSRRAPRDSCRGKSKSRLPVQTLISSSLSSDLLSVAVLIHMSSLHKDVKQHWSHACISFVHRTILKAFPGKWNWSENLPQEGATSSRGGSNIASWRPPEDSGTPR